MSQKVAAKLDELLKDDRNFDTRAGLRFMAELVRDAFQFIEDERGKQTSVEKRLANVEQGLYQFLEMRREEQKKAVEERTFYRRAVVGGIIGIALSEMARWLFI